MSLQQGRTVFPLYDTEVELRKNKMKKKYLINYPKKYSFIILLRRLIKHPVVSFNHRHIDIRVDQSKSLTELSEQLFLFVLIITSVKMNEWNNWQRLILL